MSARILVASTDPGLEQRIRSACEMNGEVVRWDDQALDSEPSAIVAQIAAHRPEVVAFGNDLPFALVLEVAGQLDREMPDVQTIAFARPTAKTLEAAMRHGVRAVLPVGAEDADLRAVMEQAMDGAQGLRAAMSGDAGGGRSRITVVVSPKGGAGRSVIATNLGLGLAHAAPEQAVLVDLDLQFGDVAGALQLVPERTMTDVGRSAQPLDLTAVKVALTPHPSGLFVLCAPEYPADGDGISAEVSAATASSLGQAFGHVVVDTAAGLNEHTLAALDVATDVVLVGSTDVPAVRGVKKVVDALDQLGMIHLTRHLVLNRADARVGIDPRDIEETVGMTIDVMLPSSRVVPVSLNHGSPILESDPDGPMAAELWKLVGRFAQLPATVSAPKAPGLRLPWRKS